MASPRSAGPLRILIVIPGKPGDQGMAFSRRQAAALAAMSDAEVETWFLQDRISPSGLLRARKSFLSTIDRFLPDVVHAHYGTMTALFCILLSPAPVVVTFHGSDLNRTPKDGFLRDLFGRVASQLAALGTAGIICVSEGLRQRLWWLREKARVIPMGVALERYVPLPREEARQQLGWPDRPRKIIFNARDSAVKRLDIALTVEEHLKRSGVEAELELLRGGITQDEMPVLLSGADALLLCSDTEGSPTMVKEAMACNLPVVTCDVGDVRQQLAGVDPGAITTQDADALTAALTRVLKDGRRSNGRAMAVHNRIDAGSLDRMTYDLLKQSAGGNAGSAPIGVSGRSMEWITVLIAIALPLRPSVLPLLVALLLCCAMWARVTHRSVPGKLTARSPLFWSAALYGAYLLGLLWSTNMDFAGLDLGIKSSLALFALLPIIGTPSIRSIRPKYAFIGANAVIVVICLARAAFRSIELYLHAGPQAHPDGYALSLPFFASGFSAFLHPTYMAMYLTLALMLLARMQAGRAGDERLTTVTALLLVLGIVLCASKAGWIILVLAGFGLLAERWSERRMRRTVGWGLLAVFLVGTTLYFTTAYVHERIGQVLNVFQGSVPRIDASNSTDDRRLVWDAASAVVASHPWTGVGTGDVKDELLKTYADRDYVEPLRKKLNAHDQYLNTGVALGIGGILLLLVMVIVPMMSAFRRGDIMLVSFLLLNAFNWTVESMLEVQAGTIFFAFFAWMLTQDETRTSRPTDLTNS